MSDDKFLLDDILAAIERIEEFKLENASHELKLSAISFQLVIIGEAVGSVSQKVKVESSHIPWQKIKDSRNFLVHQYGEINEKIVEDIVNNHLPELYKNIKEIVKLCYN